MVSDSDTMTDADKQAIRVATMNKVNARIMEVVGRLQLISRAVIGQDADGGKLPAGGLPELLADNPLGQAVDVLAAFDIAVDKLGQAASEVAARLRYAREVSMPARLDDEECTTFNTDDFRVTRTARVFASIASNMQETAFQWLRDNGYEALIKETVNSSALSGAASEIMKNGGELPDTLFSMHTKDGVSITKKRK